jgi:hypothetical protein
MKATSSRIQISESNLLAVAFVKIHQQMVFEAAKRQESL